MVFAKRVVLTEDNLTRQQLKGSLKCCFRNLEEAIQRLFFDCQMSRIMWMIVHVSFNISPLVNIEHMSTGWLNGINRKLMYKTLVGASTLYWAI
jgi:hypothetical protein